MKLRQAGYFGIVLSIFVGDHLDASLGRVLGPLGGAIGDTGAQIGKMTAELGPDANSFIDDEVEIIEELLGVAFVACQAHITSVVSGIKSLREHAEERHSMYLVTTNVTKTSIMRHGYVATAETPYSPVEVVDAFADYYKHRDEWFAVGVDWDDPKGRAADTIAVISTAGAKQGSSGNLRAGARYLGNRDYDDLSIFSAHFSRWRKGLVHAYEAELESKGLIRAIRLRRRRPPHRKSRR